MTLSLISFSAYAAVLARLAVSLLCGALIGMERGSSKHDAGLRTHIIVCLGAASVMITSQLIAERYGNVTDMTRLGAQVISGIGFLGAGSIIVNKSRVKGLTTAAGLWTTACLGLVVGAGFLEVGLTILLFIMFTTYVLRPLSLKLYSSDMTFEIVADPAMISQNELSRIFVESGHQIISIKTKENQITLHIHITKTCDKNAFIVDTISIPGISEVSEI